LKIDKEDVRHVEDNSKQGGSKSEEKTKQKPRRSKEAGAKRPWLLPLPLSAPLPPVPLLHPLNFGGP